MGEYWHLNMDSQVKTVLEKDPEKVGLQQLNKPPHCNSSKMSKLRIHQRYFAG